MSASALWWLLWSTEGKSYRQAIIEARRHYAKKLGRVPNRAEVPPGVDVKIDGVLIRQSQTVQSGTLRVAFSENKKGGKESR